MQLRCKFLSIFRFFFFVCNFHSNVTVLFFMFLHLKYVSHGNSCKFLLVFSYEVWTDTIRFPCHQTFSSLDFRRIFVSNESLTEHVFILVSMHMSSCWLFLFSQFLWTFSSQVQLRYNELYLPDPIFYKIHLYILFSLVHFNSNQTEKKVIRKAFRTLYN